MASTQFEELLALFAGMEIPPDAPVETWRAGYDGLGAMVPADPTARVGEDATVGGVPAWDVLPAGDHRRTVLYLHGGGYHIGSPTSHKALATHLAREAEARVVLLDYRLAPEHVFPAAIDDAVAAYRALLDEGTEPGRLAVAGDSAGGGLAVAALLALRDARAPLPACAVCLSPWADLTQSGGTVATKADDDPIVRGDDLDRWAASYLAGVEPTHPLASPVFADLAGLPPLLVHVGSRETLLDDARRLASRARAAGVDVDLWEADGMIHVWHQYAGLVPEADDAVRSVASFLIERTP